MEYVAVAGAAFQAIGAISGGQQRAQQYKAYAAANDYNAAAMRQRADSTVAAFGQREEQQRRQARLVLGQQRAAVAQSGTGLGGSNADVERQSEVASEMDALNIRYEDQLEASGLRGQAGLESWQTGINRSSMNYARNSGYIGAAGAILSGTGNYMRIKSGRYGYGGYGYGDYGGGDALDG